MSRPAADFLSETTGLDAEALGTRALDEAVRSRCGEFGIDEVSLVERLRRSPDEADAFLAELLVHETWLFRDRVPFEVLGALASRRVRPRTFPLRVLSFPCATGEEAWSIAATLLDAGLAPQDFRVLARDLEPGALAVAERGVYPRRAFRGSEGVRAARFFRSLGSTQAGDRIEAPAEARPSVGFARMNLLDVAKLAGDGPFDAIFCRNALVYMTPAARRRVVADLRSLLAADGLLVVGHSEVPTLLDLGFRPVGPPGAFAVTPGETGPDAPGGTRSGTGAAVPRSPERAPRAATAMATPDAGSTCTRPGAIRPEEIRRRDGAASRPSTATGTPPRDEPPAMRPALDEARRLADTGRLADAERLIRSHLEERPTSAEAHLLLGVLLVAARRTAEARVALERAIYLDPACEEALLHLAALAEGAGDRPAAARLRARAARLETRS